MNEDELDIRLNRYADEIAEVKRRTETEIAEVKRRTETEIAELRSESERWRAESEQWRAEADRLRAEGNAELKEAQRELKEAQRIVKNISKLYGNVSNNAGRKAELFFYRSLSHTPVFGGIKFHNVTPNLVRSVGGTRDEFDIVMLNDDYAAIIEVKDMAHVNVIDILRERKVRNFRFLFPEYAHYKIILGIAGKVLDDAVIVKAQEFGIGVLQQDGKAVEERTEGKLHVF